jgi:integrase
MTPRGGVWHYYRRVPAEFAHFDPRPHIKLSTKIKVKNDPSGARAARIAAGINEGVEAHWRTLAAGKISEARQAYDNAVKIARQFGFAYAPAEEVADKPLLEILTRIETLLTNGKVNDVIVGKAVLGGIERPKLMVSDLFNEYETAQKVALSKMSPDQQRRWKVARKSAVEIFIERRGDKALADITRDDAVAFSDWWQDRILNEGISVGTANKNLSHLSRMHRAINKRLKLQLDNVFSGVRIEGGRTGKRPPFSVEHIKNVILADGALDGLNDEARDVVYIIMETGARPSEIVNLDKGRIRLDAEIPYIRIQAEDRVLKTEHSERDVPLVGLALEAMRRHPDGFARYHDKGANLSGALMKHFRKHGLLETPKHKIYSFRHSFKDRLKAIVTPEEMVDEILGHRIDKPEYGDGYTLQMKRKYIQAIAFTSSEPMRAAA